MSRTLSPLEPAGFVLNGVLNGVWLLTNAVAIGIGSLQMIGFHTQQIRECHFQSLREQLFSSADNQ